MVLVPKKNKHIVYSYLFKEGVLVAKQDAYIKHSVFGIPNLHVMMLMKSLTSRGHVKEQHTWNHNYWFLTDEGIDYLREFLNLPTEIVPATLKKPSRPMGEGRFGGYGGERERGRPRFGDKDGAPRGDFKPEYRGGGGGFGRGGGFGGRGGGFGGRGRGGRGRGGFSGPPRE